MAGLSENETTTAIETVRQVALRFGSTRAFNQGMLLLFLYFMVQLMPERGLIITALALGTLTSVLLAWSYHVNPHIDRRPLDVPAKQTGGAS